MQLKGNHLQNSAAMPANTVNALIGDISFVERYGSKPTVLTDYDLRIKIHLEYVEEKLRAKDVSGLTEAQRLKRQRMLALLQEYRMAGRFPRNYDYKENRPCFIDKDGNICAVGYLVEQTAGRNVAEQINAKYKYEYLLNMQGEALERWIAASGLTKEECAMIQPTYNYRHEIIPIQPINISKVSTYEISVGYGIANQPAVNDMYRGLNVYEIYPKSRNQMHLNVAKHFWIKRWNIITGIGVRMEHYTTDERYRSIRAKSSGNHYSAMASVSFLRYFRSSQKLTLFCDAGINFQFYNMFYNNRGFLLSGGSATTSTVNGHLIQSEEIEYNLHQKSRYFITPQATLSIGAFSRIRGVGLFKPSISIAYDILKSSYLSYQFKTNDVLNNIQYAVNKDSRAISRMYFSVRVGYIINIKKAARPAS